LFEEVLGINGIGAFEVGGSGVTTLLLAVDDSDDLVQLELVGEIVLDYFADLGH